MPLRTLLAGGGTLKLDENDWPQAGSVRGGVELFQVPWGQDNPGPLQACVGPTDGRVDGADVRIEGEQTGDGFGWSVAFVGNLEQSTNPQSNFTMHEDFIVGAPRSYWPAPQQDKQLWNEKGRVYVFLSGLFSPTPYDPGQPTANVHSALEASLIIEGEEAFDRLGWSLDRADDFNGDGWPDFVVGAPGAWLPTVPSWGGLVFPGISVSSGGKVYVISGKLVEEKALAFDNGDPGATLVVSAADVVMQGVDGLGNPVEYSWEGVGASGLPGTAHADRLGFSVAHVILTVENPLYQNGVPPADPEFVDVHAVAAGAPQVIYNHTATSVFPAATETDPSGGGYTTFGHGFVRTFHEPPPGSLGTEVVIATVTHAQADQSDYEDIDPNGDLILSLPLSVEDVWFGLNVANGLDSDGDGRRELLVGAPHWDDEQWGIIGEHPPQQGPVFDLERIGLLVDAGRLYFVDPFDTAGDYTKRAHGGSVDDENFGWRAAALGNYEGTTPASSNYAIGSRNASATRTVPSVCTPCAVTYGSGGAIGGNKSGAVHVYARDDGACVQEFAGEAFRDSAGWDLIGIPTSSSGGALTGELLFSAFRWAPPPGGDDIGRIYFFPQLVP